MVHGSDYYTDVFNRREVEEAHRDGDDLQEIIEIGIESKDTRGIDSGKCKLVEREREASCVTLGCCG